MLNLFPQPRRRGSHLQLDGLISTNKQPRRDSILRIDYNISPKTSFYWRGIQDYQASKGAFDFVLASASWPQLPITYQIRSAGIGFHTDHFSPTKVNEFTFGVNRAKQTVDRVDPEAPRQQQPAESRH